MKTQLKCLCRGFGHSYALMAVDKGEDEKVSFLFKQGGREFSCVVSELREGNQFVVQLPLLRHPSFLLVRAADSEGRELCCNKFFLPSVRTTWQSRIEGKIKKDECRFIRNSDLRFARKDFAQVEFESLLFHCEGWCLKGRVIVRCSQGDAIRFKAFDDSSRDLKFTLLSQEIKSEEPNGQKFVQYNFVIQLKKIRAAVFLAVQDSISDNWLVSESLTKEQLKQLRKIHISTFTDAFTDSTYPQWFLFHRVSIDEIERQKNWLFDINPVFSIIVPLYKTPLLFFYEMVESVLKQTYSNWELILVNASPDDLALNNAVSEIVSLDERIKVVNLENNQGITENTNEGIKKATGDFLCFFDHDDTLEPDLLFEYAQAINNNPEIDLLYCDEDKLLPNGTYENPTFKPDFNLDLLRDNNYICHLLTVKKEIHSNLVPATKKLDGAQDHSLALQLAEQNGVFCHIPKILYHWRISETSTAANANSKPYATEAGIYAVSEHLKRCGIEADVECSHGRAFRYKVDYKIIGNPLISIIVTEDALVDKRSKEFLDNIFIDNKHRNIEFVIPETFVAENISDFFKKVNISIYSVGAGKLDSIVNAIGASKGSHCLFITNNIISSKYPGWVDVLLSHCSRPEIGVVGPMIVDSADFVSEAGITVVRDNTAVRLSAGQYCDAPGYIYRPLSTQEIYSIGPSCFMVKRSIIKDMALDNTCSLDEWAVYLCEKSNELGYKNIYTPEVSLVCQDELVGIFSLSRTKERTDKFFSQNFSKMPERAIHYGLSRIQGE